MSCVNKKTKRERGWRRKCRWRRMFVINALKYHQERLSGWINKVIFPPHSIIRTEPAEADKFLNYENTKGRVDMFPRERERKSTLIVSDWIWQAGDIRCVFDLRTISHNTEVNKHTRAAHMRVIAKAEFSLSWRSNNHSTLYISLALAMRRKHMLQIMMSARGSDRSRKIISSSSLHEKFASFFAYDDD